MGTNVLDPDQAWQCVLEQTHPLPAEKLPLDDALQCVLAKPVCADRDIPATDRSAMDGYAVRAGDLGTVPACLRVIGEVAAGSAETPPLASGECVRIFTGANIPPDADTVVMVEETEPGPGTPEGEQVRFLQRVTKGQHIFRQGEEARVNDILIPTGTCLAATHIGLCATVGCDRPEVYRRPRVCVITTGAELKAAGDPVAPHQIRDSNGPMLAAALAEHRMPCVARLWAPDDPQSLGNALDTALADGDVVLVTGGVSVGKYDLVPDAIRTAGATILYHGVGMKPGRPQLFARTPSGKLIFGLPGNPLSVMTGFHELALPGLRRLAGCPAERCRPLLRLPLTEDVKTKGQRLHHVLGRLVNRGDEMAVAPVPRAGSADLVAGGKANGMIMVPRGIRHAARGTRVDFRPWANTLWPPAQEPATA